MLSALAVALLAFGCSSEPVAPTKVPEITPGFVKAPLKVGAVFLGVGQGIAEQVGGLDKKYVKEGYALDLTLEELHVTGQVFFLAAQTVPVLNTTVLSEAKHSVTISVAWDPETDPIDNGSLIRACAQIVKVKEGKPDEPVSDVVCADLEPMFPL